MFSKLIIFFSLLLIGCSDKKSLSSAPISKSKEVIFYNWEDYSPKKLFTQFEKQTGIKVILKEFETVEEQMGNLQADPHFCDLTVFDTQLVPEQYLPMKLTEKLDLKKLKDTQSYHKLFQKHIEFGSPLSFGLTGFAYNTKVLKKKFTDYSFLSDSVYKNKIALLDDNDDLFLALLTALKFDYANDQKISPELVQKLEKLAIKINQNKPLIGDTFANLDALVDGQVLFAHTYSGDFIAYQKKHPHIKFIIPDFGINAWSELITVSPNAPNKENAYKLLNFLSTPEAAAKISNEFYYANGIVGSEKFLNDEIKNNALINMPDDHKEKSKFYTRSTGHNSISQRLFSILKKSN